MSKTYNVFQSQTNARLFKLVSSTGQQTMHLLSTNKEPSEIKSMPKAYAVNTIKNQSSFNTYVLKANNWFKALSEKAQALSGKSYFRIQWNGLDQDYVTEQNPFAVSQATINSFQPVEFLETEKIKG